MNVDWDDMRVFLQVERTGRLVRAARRLGISHTTVARRLSRLEERCGCPLFRPTETGLTLTEAGQAIHSDALAMEAAAERMASTIGRFGRNGAMRVRVGAPDGFGSAILTALLADLARTDPGFEIELVPVPAVHKLWRRDVDIAVSLDRPEGGRIVMRKLVDYDLRLYASPDYLGTHPVPSGRGDLMAHPFVGYIDELRYTEELDFLRHIAPDLRISFRAATVHAQLDAVRRGVGLGILPFFLAAPTELVPLLPEEIGFRRTYWLLYPEDFRAQDRIRKTAGFIHDRTTAMAADFLFEPGRGRTTDASRRGRSRC